MSQGRFVLEHRGRAFAIEPGVVLTVGRGDACDVRIDDDARVSRHHATFALEAAGLVVEDHRSRNGVLLNGGRIVERAVLRAGDRVTIGAQVFTVHAEHELPRALAATITRQRRSRPPTPPRGSETTTEQVESTPKLLIEAALEALAGDRLADAKHAGHAAATTVGAILGLGLPADPRLLAGLARVLIRLGQRTGDPEWLDELFDLHRQAGRLLDADAVFALSAIDAGLRARSTDAAAAYVAGIATSCTAPADAMRLRRLEGLF